MNMEDGVDSQIGSETRRYVAFVIQPPRDLCAAIEYQSIAARDALGGLPPPLSPPHVTVLYMPNRILDLCRLRRAITTIRATMPFTLLYAGIRVSSYGTVQLQVHPRQTLQRMHISLVSALGLDGLAELPAARLLERIGTSNFGQNYTPHITLGHFGTRAIDVAHHFASIRETEQPLFDLWAADATGALNHRFAIRLQGTDVG